MDYKILIVNCPNSEDFFEDVRILLSQGYDFTFRFLKELHTEEGTLPGSWGGLRFAVLPPQKLFGPDDVEYRYSDEQGVWLADGQPTPYNGTMIGLSKFFDQVEDGQI